MKDTIDFILVAVYNLTILGGTAYLVSEKNWSGWWFLLATLLLATKTKVKD